MEKRTLNEMIERLYNYVLEMEMDLKDKTFILSNLIAIGQKSEEIRRILMEAVGRDKK